MLVFIPLSRSPLFRTVWWPSLYNLFLSKSFEFVFLCCEFTKVIFFKLCEKFVLNLSGIQQIFFLKIKWSNALLLSNWWKLVTIVLIASKSYFYSNLYSHDLWNQNYNYFLWKNIFKFNFIWYFGWNRTQHII